MGYAGYGANENAIEFLRDEKIATCTFTQGKYISRVRKLAEKYPDECKIVAENKDGSVVAQVPVKWVKVSPPRSVDLTPERKQELADRMRSLHQK